MCWTIKNVYFRPRCFQNMQSNFLVNIFIRHFCYMLACEGIKWKKKKSTNQRTNQLMKKILKKLYSIREFLFRKILILIQSSIVSNRKKKILCKIQDWLVHQHTYFFLLSNGCEKPKNPCSYKDAYIRFIYYIIST